MSAAISVYFPDRVVPMLPQALSNELCSLKPHEDRACMAAHMWIDGAGGDGTLAICARRDEIARKADL